LENAKVNEKVAQIEASKNWHHDAVQQTNNGVQVIAKKGNYTSLTTKLPGEKSSPVARFLDQGPSEPIIVTG
jgi:hypothetical protein